MLMTHLWFSYSVYTTGFSKDVRQVCSGMMLLFKSGQPLCPGLTKVKDLLPMQKQSKVVYRITFCCSGKSYIGGTRRRLETRLREHLEACWRGTLEVSVVAEHSWKDQHSVKFNGDTTQRKCIGSSSKPLYIKHINLVILSFPNIYTPSDSLTISWLSKCTQLPIGSQLAIYWVCSSSQLA